MQTQEVSTGYEPRELQEYLHNKLKRFNVLVCHRRFGKSVFCINEMIDQALRCEKRNPKFAFIAPTYKQAKIIIWDYLKDYTRNIPGAIPNEADLNIVIKRPGSDDKITIALFSADKPDSIRGIYLDGCVFDEYGDIDPNIFTKVVRPLLTDRRGWCIFIGTFSGMNHFYDIYQKAKTLEDGNWFHCDYKASETKIIDQDELDDARAIMGDDDYLQEFENKVSAKGGAYYGKHINELEDKGQIASVPYDTAVPVYTAWDLGISDSTAIWFCQAVGKELHLIDYIENSGVGLDWYIQEIKARGYIYETHILPHDAEARELTSGKSRVQTLRGFRVGRMEVLPRHNVDDGIHAVRMMLSRCFFDKVKTERGVDALRNYEKKFDAKNKTYAVRPLHNWASHSSDAFRYLAMGLREGRDPVDRVLLPRQAITDYDLFGG